MKPFLIIFSGLPGVGKSTLARKLCNHLNAFYIRIDSIEQALRCSSLQIDSVEDSGYKVGYALAEENLRLGNTVIADSVNPLELTRTAWLNVADQARAYAIEIEITCSNTNEHKMRIENRTTDIKGLKLPSWSDVLKKQYESWEREHIVIDTANCSITEATTKLLDMLNNLPTEKKRGY